MYTKQLPSMHDVERLSTLVRSYPATRAQILRTARMWNFKPELVSLLRQFPAEHSFESRLDFFSRVEEICLLIRQQWESPKEFLLSP